MTFKVLLTADIHMSNKLPYSKPGKNDVTDRLVTQLELWKQFGEIAEAQNVKAIFVLGDLFDKSVVDAITLTHTVEALVELSTIRPVYILPGNHDANSITGGRFVVEALGAMRKKRIHVIGEKPAQSLHVKSDGKDVSFWPVSFKTVGETKAELAEIRKTIDKKHFNVLLMHNSVQGAEHLGWVCDDGLDGEVVCEGFDRVYSGHFHNHQSFGTCGMYLGAPMQHNYGDVGRETICHVVAFEKKGRVINLVEDQFELNAPKFHTFNHPDHFVGSADGIPKGDYARLEVVATHSEWSAVKGAMDSAVRQLEKKGIHSEVKHRPQYHHDNRMGTEVLSEGMSLKDAVSAYVRASGVVTDSLDPDRLVELGRNILADVESEQGYGTN